MKPFSFLLMLFCFSIIIPSCSSSDCEEDAWLTVETRDEHKNWRAADAAFFDDPSEENCQALRSTAALYLAKLQEIESCINDGEKDDFDSRVARMTADADWDCN